MRIGIEAQRLFRPHKHGMDVVALQLIRALQQIQSPHEYFVFVRPDTDRKCLSPSPNVTIVEINAPNYALWEQWYLPKKARELRLDLLHCTANTAPLFCDIPLILTLHDVIFMEKLATKSSATAYQRYGNLYRRWIVPQIAKQAAHIVTVSHYEKGQIEARFPHISHKTSVVYNGISSFFKQIAPPTQNALVRQRYRLPDSYLFFLGNTDPKKNLNNVLCAFEEVLLMHPYLTLVIADLPETLLDKHLRMLRLTAIKKHIQCIGYVPSFLLPAIYEQAALFLYPSLRESFGLPILEAMACGTPVVTSAAAAMPEIAGDAAVFVCPSSHKSIAKGIIEAIEDEELRAIKIAKGYQRVAHFSWETTAQQVQQLYEQIHGLEATSIVSSQTSDHVLIPTNT